MTLATSPTRSLLRLCAAALLVVLLLAACRSSPTTPDPTPEPARIAAFTAAPQTVAVGAAVTYAWQLEHAEAETTTCTLDVNGNGAPNYVRAGAACLTGAQAHAFAAAGTYTATLNVMAGEAVVSQQVSVVVTEEDEDPTPDAPRIAAFAVAPQMAATGASVTFSWRLEQAEATATTCTLDVTGDGSPDYTFSGAACLEDSQAHAFAAAGTYTARFSASSGGTELSRPVSVVVSDPDEEPSPTLAAFGASPATLPAGTSTTFSWRLENAAPATTTCALDANGDGTPEYTFSGEKCLQGTQAHSFAAAGSYAARFSAASGGTDLSQPFTVTVTEPPDTTVPDDFTRITWTQARSQPYRVAEAQGLAVGGKLYVFGGFDSTKSCCTPTDRAYAYDPVSNTWQALAPLPPMNNTGRGGVTHAGIATDGTDIYLVSGYTSNAAGTGQIFGTREAWRYNVASNDYTRLPDLPAIRSAGQLEYLSGKLHYFGGTNSSRTRDTAEHYVLDLNGGTSWTTAAPLPNPRNHMGSAVLGGRIYAVAGQHGHDSALVTQADVHAYDPETDTWEARAPLPKAVSHISSMTFTMGERIIVLGGETAHGSGYAVANAYAYSPDTDTWTALSNLPRVLRSSVAGVLNGKIIVTGGSGGGTRNETYIGTPTR